MSKKTYHEIKTDQFEILNQDKLMTISCQDFMKACGLHVLPWLKTTNAQIAEGDKNTEVPRIRMISSVTGKRCTFFLTERLKEHYVFMPSVGSLMNKVTGLPHLKGWKVLLKR